MTCPFYSLFHLRSEVLACFSGLHLACCLPQPRGIRWALHSRYIQNPAGVSLPVLLGPQSAWHGHHLSALVQPGIAEWQGHNLRDASRGDFVMSFQLHNPRRYRSITQCGILMQSRDVLNTRWMRLRRTPGLSYSKLFIHMHPCVYKEHAKWI